MNNRFITGYIEKSASSSGLPTFVLNEESPDRMGDIIEVAGWNLRNFKRNPIALWGHDQEKIVGRWHNIRVEGKQLLADLQLAGTRLGQMAAQLIDEGILKAVSVGFLPIEYDPIDKDEPYGAWRIKAAELLETSLVSVPAHPNALLLSKRLGLSDAERRLIFESRGSKAAVSGHHHEDHHAVAAIEAAEKAILAARHALRLT